MGRHLLLVVATLVATGLGPRIGPVADPRTAMFRGNPEHTGFYDAPTGVALAGLQWRVDLGGGVISSPAILGDTVWIGSAAGGVYAIDRVTGQTHWSKDLGSPIVSSPAVADGRVIVGTRDGRYYGLRSSTGAVLWQRKSGADLPFPWGHESGDLWTASPVLVGPMAIVGFGDGGISAIDAATGRVRWRAATKGRIRSSPAVADGRVFVGSADGIVYCFDLATGREHWRFATAGAGLESGKYGFDRRTIQSSPAVSGNTVVIGARDGFLYALAADSGTERWRFDYKVSWINAAPAIADGVVYVGTSDGQFVNAIDLATGAERWRAPAVGTVWSSAAVTRDLVIVGQGSGRVVGYDRKTGAERWAFVTEAAVHSSPVPTGSLVVVGSADGGVYAIRTAATAPIRAVYLDPSIAVKEIPADTVLARVLGGRGYQTLGGAELVGFLRARIQDRAPSQVVFAGGDLPADAVTAPFEGSLFRRYLEAGGKVVWVRGMPPLLCPRNPDTGAACGGLSGFRWDDPGRLLGIDMSAAMFDQRMARPTERGHRWGLTARWRDGWGIAVDQVSEVLAVDDWRLAASWVKSYGGPGGTGFVRAPANQHQATYLLTEYRPVPQP